MSDVEFMHVDGGDETTEAIERVAEKLKLRAIDFDPANITETIDKIHAELEKEKN
jgi:hypothetical protein